MTLSLHGSVTNRGLIPYSSVNSAGTAYTLTATAAALDFGTTDPSLTITSPGTYLIMATANIVYTAATFAAVRDVTLKLRRTNNTAADLTGGSVVTKTGIITTLTYTMQTPSWSVLYTTANNNDVITIFGDVGVLPTAGTLDISAASLIAIRIA